MLGFQLNALVAIIGIIQPRVAGRVALGRFEPAIA